MVSFSQFQQATLSVLDSIFDTTIKLHFRNKKSARSRNYQHGDRFRRRRSSLSTVWKLKLPLQQQIIVAMLFRAGFIINYAGAIRNYYLHEVTIGWDKTWTAFPAWVN